MNNLLFSIENISLMSTIMINFILIIIVSLIKNKTKNNYFFIGFISSIFLWTVSTFVFVISPLGLGVLSAKLFYISGCIIPVFIILFTSTFPQQNLNFKKIKLFLFLLFPTFICISTMINGLVVNKVELIDGYKNIVFGPMYKFLFLYIIAYFAMAFVFMYKKYITLSGIERKQAQIMFTSMIFATVSALFVSLVMPSLGNFSLFWAGPFFSGYMLLTITYAIIRYGLFNIKLVATEFLTLSIWMILFVKIFFDNTNKDLIIDSVILVLVIISGILIIKSVQKENELRDRLEKTNIDLQALDKKKSEFMSLATHQLRAPLTAMKGYSSMILDGTFGSINNPEIEDAVTKISRSTSDLTMIVEDYLNISRIEQGSMRYSFSNCDLIKILEDVISSVKDTASRAGLKIIFEHTINVNHIVKADEGKMKQVFLNIIDNAVKYTPEGSVSINMEQTTDNTVLVKIKDSGVGIHHEVLPTLFNRYVRAPDASKINILGTGLGLYVAGEILKAHDGRAWAESEGENKGSTFFVELKNIF